MDNIVVIDIGNTSTSMAMARGMTMKKVRHFKGSVAKPSTVLSELKSVVGNTHVAGSVLCSVVPAANMTWISILTSELGKYPLVVNHKMDFGLKISYPKPASIGADRLANACGAVYRYGAPVIVADFGTALTFDVICPLKGYIGGAIAPGLPLMTDYLADKTALLPYIELKGNCGYIGRSTEGAMRIGAQIGYRGIVREIVKHLEKDTTVRNAILCATGGYANWVLKGLDMNFELDPNLTLKGLSRIYQLNS